MQFLKYFVVKEACENVPQKDAYLIGKLYTDSVAHLLQLFEELEKDFSDVQIDHMRLIRESLCGRYKGYFVIHFMVPMAIERQGWQTVGSSPLEE
jgi:hypothetical protein